MSQPIGAPRRAVPPVDSDPNADELLRRAREAASDRAAHDAASYVRPGLSSASVATLDRLCTALGVQV